MQFSVPSVAGAVTLGLALAVSPVVIPNTAPEAEAVAFRYIQSRTSIRHVTVYEKWGCEGDWDYVFPGEVENSKKVKIISSVRIANNTGYLLNGALRKRKRTGAKCVNIYITYPGTVIGHTY